MSTWGKGRASAKEHVRQVADGVEINEIGSVLWSILEDENESQVSEQHLDTTPGRLMVQRKSELDEGVCWSPTIFQHSLENASAAVIDKQYCGTCCMSISSTSGIFAGEILALSNEKEVLDLECVEMPAVAHVKEPNDLHLVDELCIKLNMNVQLAGNVELAIIESTLRESSNRTINLLAGAPVEEEGCFNADSAEAPVAACRRLPIDGQDTGKNESLQDTTKPIAPGGSVGESEQLTQLKSKLEEYVSAGSISDASCINSSKCCLRGSASVNSEKRFTCTFPLCTGESNSEIPDLSSCHVEKDTPAGDAFVLGSPIMNECGTHSNQTILGKDLEIKALVCGSSTIVPKSMQAKSFQTQQFQCFGDTQPNARAYGDLGIRGAQSMQYCTDRMCVTNCMSGDSTKCFGRDTNQHQRDLTNDEILISHKCPVSQGQNQKHEEYSTCLKMTECSLREPGADSTAESHALKCHELSPSSLGTNVGSHAVNKGRSGDARGVSDERAADQYTNTASNSPIEGDASELKNELKSGLGYPKQVNDSPRSGGSFSSVEEHFDLGRNVSVFDTKGKNDSPCKCAGTGSSCVQGSYLNTAIGSRTFEIQVQVPSRLSGLDVGPAKANKKIMKAWEANSVAGTLDSHKGKVRGQCIKDSRNMDTESHQAGDQLNKASFLVGQAESIESTRRWATTIKSPHEVRPAFDTTNSKIKQSSAGHFKGAQNDLHHRKCSHGSALSLRKKTKLSPYAPEYIRKGHYHPAQGSLSMEGRWKSLNGILDQLQQSKNNVGLQEKGKKMACSDFGQHHHFHSAPEVSNSPRPSSISMHLESRDRRIGEPMMEGRETRTTCGSNYEYPTCRGAQPNLSFSVEVSKMDYAMPYMAVMPKPYWATYSDLFLDHLIAPEPQNVCENDLWAGDFERQEEQLAFARKCQPTLREEYKEIMAGLVYQQRRK